MQFSKFEPNRKATFTCSSCNHAFHQHVIAKTFRGCLVNSCKCEGVGTFTRPRPPMIEEYVTDLRTGARIRINQPAPPAHLGLV